MTAGETRKLYAEVASRHVTPTPRRRREALLLWMRGRAMCSLAPLPSQELAMQLRDAANSLAGERRFADFRYYFSDMCHGDLKALERHSLVRAQGHPKAWEAV